ncbi:MAG TPA: ABC transporter substrate-binding protein, partial [Termitinemataceae bacterium]|nr:ABC transporter substrate-binding protein [Termitinemataceae bacterium]
MNLKRIVTSMIAMLVIASLSVSAQTKPVKISFWHIGTAPTDKGFYQSVVDEFMKTHPNVTIEVTIL